MAPTVKKAQPASAAAPAKATKKPRGKARNYDLGNGVVRFSRSSTFHKKALYKFVGKKVAKAEKPKKPVSVEKPIGGDKNGGKRTVLLHKRHGLYPTQNKIAKHPSKKCFRQHKRHLRPSLQPGTVCIVLAGQHKGKRVVMLKQLASGLLLVTGPFLINACPLRRISQNYVIATSTKLDVSSVKLPEHLNDDYFKRQKNKRAKKEEGDIFAAKKEAYKPSEQRKVDQKAVDKMVLAVIKKHPEHKLLYTYLSAMFGLRSSQYPHRMKF